MNPAISDFSAAATLLRTRLTIKLLLKTAVEETLTPEDRSLTPILSACPLVEVHGPAMDKVTRCPKCGKRTIAIQIKGRTELTCIRCDPVDPLKTELAKWADSPLAPPK
jgi:hypothetical protein